MADHPANETRDGDGDGDELISRLRVIEEQPLAARAESYAALHDELAQRLESGPENARG
jgi:hypothetical protein